MSWCCACTAPVRPPARELTSFSNSNVTGIGGLRTSRTQRSPPTSSSSITATSSRRPSRDSSFRRGWSGHCTLASSRRARSTSRRLRHRFLRVGRQAPRATDRATSSSGQIRQPDHGSRCGGSAHRSPVPPSGSSRFRLATSGQRTARPFDPCRTCSPRRQSFAASRCASLAPSPRTGRRGLAESCSSAMWRSRSGPRRWPGWVKFRRASSTSRRGSTVVRTLSVRPRVAPSGGP